MKSGLFCVIMPMRRHFLNFLRQLFSGKNEGNKSFRGFREETIPPEFSVSYAAVISKTIPYFNKLNAIARQNFLQRVYNFRKHKNFHYHALPPQEEMAVLVSAAAVQLTFGLKNYLLPYFTDIYLTADAYEHKDSKELFIGHVSPTGIYISWKHFVKGFADSSDGNNVALHEMAHALHHENFVEETGIDWDFREDFDKLPAIFGPVLSQAIIEKKSYLRGYAFTNFHEFWAVCIEYFFEDPGGFRQNLPQLYSLICKTLNQDPEKKDDPRLEAQGNEA